MHPDCEKSCWKSSSERAGSPVTNSVTAKAIFLGANELYSCSLLVRTHARGCKGVGFARVSLSAAA